MSQTERLARRRACETCGEPMVAHYNGVPHVNHRRGRRHMAAAQGVMELYLDADEREAYAGLGALGEFMRGLAGAILLAFLCSGCYSLGPLVTEVRPVSAGDGRARVEVRRCSLAWGMFKQLQLEDCGVETIEPLPQTPRKR